MKNGLYELVLAPSDYIGKKYRGRYCYEHILVYWKSTGVFPPKGYEIHHKDMNHRNNKIENLQLVSSKEHRKIHSDILTKKSTISVNCGFCNKKFDILKSVAKFRVKLKKHKKLFCSHSCGSKNQHSKIK